MFEIILLIAVVWLVIHSISQSHKLYNLEVKVEQLSKDKIATVNPASTIASTGVVSDPSSDLGIIKQGFDDWKQAASNPDVDRYKDATSEHLDSTAFINALPKIGVVALVIGLGFFLKYAIDQGWISETLRLLIGGSIGSLFLILSYLWFTKYKKYSLVLAGGGLAIWYLTLYAAVNMYSLLDYDFGLIVLAVITFSGLLIAYKTQSKEMSVLAWGAGFLAPIVLGISAVDYSLVLIYLTLLTGALLAVITYTKARYLFAIAIGGFAFNMLIAANSASSHTSYYEFTLIALAINFVSFTIYIVHELKHNKEAVTENKESDLAIAFAVTYLVVAIPMIMIVHNQYNEFVALFSAVLGVWTLLVYSLVEKLEQSKINYILTGIGMFLFSLAVLWQFGEDGQVVMLYLLGIIGLTVGRLHQRPEIRAWSVVVILLGIFASFTVPYISSFGWMDETSPANLLLNKKFALEFLGVISLIGAYFMFRKDELTAFEKDIHKGLLYLVAVLIWFIVSWDLLNYFGGYQQTNQRNLSLSIWWLIYAVAMTMASSVKALTPIRKLAMLLFGLVIVKVFLYDLQTLETLYRIVSFISLGVILLVISFVYQKNKQKIKEYLDIK